MFNLISNGKGYVQDLKEFFAENKKFKECFNKVCIYCRQTQIYEKEKNENPNFISIITKDRKNVLKFIEDTSSKDIKTFSLI